MKKVFISLAVIAFSISAFAGGLLTNTNQSARFLRNPARDASTEIDAVYSNPAGLSFMKHDGFTLSLNNQMAFQTRTITSSFAPFAYNGGSDTKIYKGKANAFFIPSLQAAYKLKNWVFSGSFAIVGGGGKLKYKDGLPMFEAQVAMLPVTANELLKGLGMADAISRYSLDQYLEGSSITYGTQLGVNYKVKDMFSFFAGARASFVRNGYNGYIKDIKVNPNIPLLGFSGDNMILAKDFLAAIAPLIPPELGVNPAELLAQVADRTIDLKQKGWGIAPILGVNFNYKDLIVGIKYEFKTGIKLKNKTKENSSGLNDFDDGVKTRNDLPALLAAGVSYKFLKEKLIASAGFHFFFDKYAKMANDKQKDLKGNTYEILLGLEYVINDKFLVSAGGQLTRLGLTDKFQSNMSFYCNSFSIGTGGGYNILPQLTLNLSYLYTNFAKYTNNNPMYRHPVFGGKEVYARTSHAIGIGLDYRF